MSKGNTFETELLEHILNNADVALIGDALLLDSDEQSFQVQPARHTWPT